MSNKINSRVIGQLTQDERFSDWWRSEEISVPFFGDKKFPIIFVGFNPKTDKQFIEQTDDALKRFFGLKEDDRQAISNIVHQNCIDFLNTVDLDEIDEPYRNIQHEEVWNFVHPSEIYVARRDRRDEDIYITVACECDWEQEHGLQLVFRQGKKLTRVSGQDGHLTEADAYDKPDEKDELLSKF